jgi:hypothetical protein
MVRLFSDIIKKRITALLITFGLPKEVAVEWDETDNITYEII